MEKHLNYHYRAHGIFVETPYYDVSTILLSLPRKNFKITYQYRYET